MVGMLASAESIEVVADAFRRYNVTTSVVDPVRSPIPIIMPLLCSMITLRAMANGGTGDGIDLRLPTSPSSSCLHPHRKTASSDHDLDAKSARSQTPSRNRRCSGQRSTKCRRHRSHGA
jgi:hypothetical protein